MIPILPLLDKEKEPVNTKRVHKMQANAKERMAVKMEMYIFARNFIIINKYAET